MTLCSLWVSHSFDVPQQLHWMAYVDIVQVAKKFILNSFYERIILVLTEVLAALNDKNRIFIRTIYNPLLNWIKLVDLLFSKRVLHLLTDELRIYGFRLKNNRKSEGPKLDPWGSPDREIGPKYRKKFWFSHSTIHLYTYFVARCLRWTTLLYPRWFPLFWKKSNEY